MMVVNIVMMMMIMMVIMVMMMVMMMIMMMMMDITFKNSVRQVANPCRALSLGDPRPLMSLLECS